MKTQICILAISVSLCSTSLCIPFFPAHAETFQQALVQAYQTNPDLQAEQAKLREVDEQVSQALSNWRPSIDATGSIGRSDDNVLDHSSSSLALPSNDSGKTPRSVGVQITQPIFRGFRTTAATEAAEKQVDAERANLEAIEQKLFLDAGTAYLDVVHDQALVEFDRTNEDVLRQELDAVQQRFAAGELTRTDADQAQSRLKRAEADRIGAEGHLSDHQAVYTRLTGLVPGNLQQPELQLNGPNNIDDATALADKQNPNVLAATYSEDEARKEVTFSKGSLLPEVSIVGSTQRQWNESTFVPGREDTSKIMLQVTVPLYRSGSDYSKVRAAQQAVTERRMQLEGARREAHETATSSWHDLMTARGALAADQAEVQAATSALEGVREQAIVGTRTTLDMLNAEQELIDAKTGVIQAQHDIAVAVLKIKSATGTLTAKALDLPVHLYDPDRNYQKVRGQWIGFADTEDDERDHSDRLINATKQAAADKVPATAADTVPASNVQNAPLPQIANAKQGIIGQQYPR